MVEKISLWLRFWPAKNHPFLAWLLLLPLAFLFSKGLTDPDVGWPDADRILMDGLFIHDFLRDLTFAELFNRNLPHTTFQYALNYFAHYPALSLGSRPPFFPFIEAIFFFIFGVQDWSGKLAVIVTALLGTLAWYDLVRRTHDRPTALLACGFLFTTPFIAYWTWYPMLEIPALTMCLITANLFWRYTTSGQLKWLYLSAFAFCLALWTKQTTLFMLLWFIPWLIYTGRIKEILTKKSTWGVVIMVLILTVPLGFLTIWMGKMNMALTVEGVDPELQGLGLTDWAYLRQYIDLLVYKQVTPPILWLGAFGVIGAIWQRDRKAIFYLLLIVATYLFFTSLRSYRIDRYTIFWVPAFALFAALPFYYIRNYALAKPLGWLLAILIIALQANETIAKPPAITRGYQEAAKLAATHSRHGVIFMDGANNGYFTYFVRLNDPNKRLWVIRGDKLLHSSAIFSDSWAEVHVKSLDEIKTHFDQHGIDIVVIEARNYTQFAIHDTLREYLRSDAFEQLASIPVDSRRSQLINQNLLIYRYKQAKPPSGKTFSMSVPLVGMKFQLPVGESTGQTSP